MRTKIKSLDIYGEQINLTYKGDDTFKTLPGAVSSLIVITILLSYGLFRTYVLFNTIDPSLSKPSFLRNLQEEGEFKP